MQAMIALIKREYLEHRGAFILGPVILVGLMLLASVYATWSFGAHSDFGDEMPSALRFYEAAFALLAAGWWFYLLIMLFFYFADAFSADSRNNSMLFWKSMPQSDFKIFGAKMGAAYTIFPTAILLAVAISGIIAYLPALTVGNSLAGYTPPSFGDTVVAYLNILATAVVFYALGLLWYAPFFAWVGLLSVLFRRWAIPLAFLIPTTIGLFENLVTRGGNRDGGVVYNFLKDRMSLSFDSLEFDTIWFLAEPWRAPDLIARMLTGMDWVSLIGGLAVAAVILYVASEYRRRYVLA